MNCAVHTETQAVAYCRTCGKALCEECKRDVMGAIYCEPCIAARLQGQSTTAPFVAPPSPAASGAPNPVLAGLLGFIPGVGAMYNGQFVKAFVHVVIFVLLIIGADYHWAFGMMIGFWVCYMAFEAYKTAEARRMGLPPPDPLGLDKIFGLQDSQQAPPAAVGTTATSASAPVASNVQAPMPPPAQVIAPPPPAQDNAPVGAIVLIALGAIFLLS